MEYYKVHLAFWSQEALKNDLNIYLTRTFSWRSDGILGTTHINMLSQFETKLLDWVYSACVSRLSIVSLKWKNNILSAKLKSRRICSLLICSILTFEACISFTKIRALKGQQNINLTILQTIILLRYPAHIYLRLNFELFKMEMVRVINQSSCIDISWGTTNSLEYHENCTTLYISIFC